MRIGQGYDVHQLVPGRRLVLGGVEIPYEKGLLGHSDADVLLHAVCDALLGAAALGDIGRHFPDSDPAYKDIGSMKLLIETYQKIRKEGFAIGNIDTTLFVQAPKIAPYRQKMVRRIAEALELDEKRINIKATTTEGLGMIGAGEGMAAMCIALLEQVKNED